MYLDTAEKVEFFCFIGLFNLRGSDIAYNPVFMAYAIVTSKEALYVYTMRSLTSLNGATHLFC